MSYARFGAMGSDVYVFLASNHLECCGCNLGDGWYFYSTDDMLAHLRDHRAAGHSVPQYAFDGLEADRADLDYIEFADSLCESCQDPSPGRATKEENTDHD